jgi:N-hydroxyarylamine O-acetyltransferase
MSASLDLDAYFARTGYTGPREPTLAVLHDLTLRHATGIPFETLDVLLGRPISLAPEDIFRKLVREGRGGYCFEQNGLFYEVLTSLGFAVTRIGARVRWMIPRDVIPARTHLFLRVDLPGEGAWFTDVGMGIATLTSAIPLRYDEELLTPHEPRRLVREGDRHFHQLWTGTAWTDANEFSFFDMHPIDCEMANWWTSGHPSSRFRSTPLVAIAGLDGTRKAISGGEFTHRLGPKILENRPITSAADFRETLATHFNLHFPAETRFGPEGAIWAD